MSHTAEAAAPASRDRSIEARRAARRKKAEREMRIVGYLNSGVSVAEIAARERVTDRRMRMLVGDILARRQPQPPAEFLALQVNRLHEALIVSYGAMSESNLEAVDRVVKIVRELDRYHGFVAREPVAAHDPPRLAAPSQRPLALDAPVAAPEAIGDASH